MIGSKISKIKHLSYQATQSHLFLNLGHKWNMLENYGSKCSKISLCNGWWNTPDRTTYHVWGWNHPKLGSLAPTCLMLHCDSLPPDKLQLQSTYSSWKVDGAVTLYWFVSRSPVLTYLFGIGICAMYFDRGVKFSEPASQLHLIFHDWFVWPAFLGLGTCCAINITNPKSPSPW